MALIVVVTGGSGATPVRTRSTGLGAAAAPAPEAQTPSLRPAYLPDGLGYERTVLDASAAATGGAYLVSFYDDLVGAVPADGKVLPSPKRLIVINVITGPAKVGGFADAPADRRATVRGQQALVIPQGDEVGLKWVEDPNTTIFMSGRGVDLLELEKVANSLEGSQK